MPTTLLTNDDIMALAKGSEQREFVRLLIAGHTPHNYARTVIGRASHWRMQYERSFDNLIARLRSAGVEIERTPGPRGGEHSATYRLVR